MNRIVRLPWAKIPSDLPLNPDVWAMSAQAICVLVGVFCLAGAAGTSDTGLTREQLAWTLRVDNVAFVDEALASGVLKISDACTVAVALPDWDVPGMDTAGRYGKSGSASSSTERSRAARERKKSEAVALPVASVAPTVASVALPVASVALPVASVAPTVASVALPVASVAFPVAPSRVDIDIDIENNPPKPPVASEGGNSGGGGVLSVSEKRPTSRLPPRWADELSYPCGISPADRASIVRILDSTFPATAQEILDELTGTLLAGIEVRTPPAWVRSVAVKAAAGDFIPERGLRVANRRNNPVILPVVELPRVLTAEETARCDRETEATIAAIKDGPLAESLRRGLLAMQARRGSEWIKNA